MLVSVGLSTYEEQARLLLQPPQPPARTDEMQMTYDSLRYSVYAWLALVGACAVLGLTA